MKLKKLALEAKIMGSSYYVPYLLMLILIGFTLIVKTHNREYFVYSVLENTIPLFGAWWTIYFFGEFLDKGKEVLHSYEKSYSNYSIWKNMIFYIKYVLISYVTMIILMKYKLSYIHHLYIIHVLIQAFFFLTLSYLLIFVIKDIAWCFFIIVSYMIVEYFTRGSFAPFINIYLFQGHEVSDNQLIINILKCMKLSLIFVLLGYLISKHKVLRNLLS